MLDLVTCTLGPSGFSTPKVQFSLLQDGTGQSAGTLSGQITIPCLLGLAGSFLISRNCCVSLTLGYPHPCRSWDALLSAWSSSLRLGKAILVSNTRGRGAQTHSFSPRSGPSSPRTWTGSPEVRNPSRTTPPNTEARNRWPPQIRAGGSLVRPLTVCGRDELGRGACPSATGCSWCVVGRRGRQRQQYTVFRRRQAGGSKYGHAIGSLAPGRSADASHRKPTNQPNPAPKCHTSRQQGREAGAVGGHGVQLGRHQTCTAASASCIARAVQAAGIPAHLGTGERLHSLPSEGLSSCYLGEDALAFEFQMASCPFCLQAVL